MSELIPRLLIVESDAGYAAFLKRALSDLTPKIRFVSTLVQAKRALKAFRPDMVVLDVGLPDGDALDIARELRAQGVSGQLVLIAVLTADASVRDGTHWLAAGADTCWAKIRCGTRIAALVQGLWRRHVNDSCHVSWKGDRFIFEPATRRFFCAGHWSKPLTPREILVFSELRSASPDPVPRRRLIRDYIKDGLAGCEEMALNVLIARLRKKFPYDVSRAIETLDGIGYRLNREILK